MVTHDAASTTTTLIERLRGQIDDLQKRANNTSQQLQREVLELELEDILREKFPHDIIEAVSTGARGADILQTVRTPAGDVCGRILWETKRTQAWSKGWIDKLKSDQRAQGADVAVLLSVALPEGLRTFENRDGIWVTCFNCAAPLAAALRVALHQVARARHLQIDRTEKKEILFEHICSVKFRQTVEALLTSYDALREQFEKEKRSCQKIWAAREKNLDLIGTHTVELFGGVQGIVGEAALPDVAALALPGD